MTPVPIASTATNAQPAPAEILVLNRGVPGNNSGNGLARFQRDVLAAKPDHVIICFGINDACNSQNLVPFDRFQRNIQTMINRAQTAGIHGIVLVPPNPIIHDYWIRRHPTHPFKDDIATYLAKYDAAIRVLARMNHLDVADLRRLVEEHGGASVADQSLIRNEVNSKSQDGVHLTAKGYQLMAELFDPIFKDRVKPGQTVVCLGDSITYGANTVGAGTSYGQTYPAWLWLTLNRRVGATDRMTPREPPPGADSSLRGNDVVPNLCSATRLSR